MSTEVRVLAPGEMEPPVGEIPFLFLPERDLFARRAGRLRFLSNGNSLGEYLAFLAKLADAQQDALNRFPRIPLPGADEPEQRRAHAVPLLDALSRPRPRQWRTGLAMILQHLSAAALPPEARGIAGRLSQANEAELEEKADAVLAGHLALIAPGELPFIAAGLQVQWVHMASSLREDAVGRPEQAGLCPVCGYYPGIGLVTGSGRGQGLRYLSCSLCGSRWHMVRIRCSSCGSTHGINFYSVEGSNGAVKAESCSTCDSYLKLLYLAKDRLMEPAADDLATLSLDILMNEKGKTRRGPNLFFHPGMPH